MSADGSVTRCITELKAGGHSAAERLWQAYFQRLVGLARAKLGPRPGRLPTRRNMALGAFKSLCLGAARGRFPQLRETATTSGPCWPC